MKLLLSLILTSSIAVGVALILSQGGYITFWWSEWRVDTALSTFLIFLFLLFVLFWIIFKILFEIFLIPEKAKKYREKVKESKKVESVFKLVFSYLQGNYKRVISEAEKLQKNFKIRQTEDYNSITLVDYLSAISADKVGNNTLRDSYIKRMEPNQKPILDSYIFVDLLKIQAFLKSKKITDAVNLVSQVQKKHVNNLEFLKLQLKVSDAAENWEEVLRLSRIIEKKIYDDSYDTNYFKCRSVEKLLQLADKNPVLIKKVIGLIKNDYKKNAKLTYLLASSHMKVGNESKARDILEYFLDKSWSKFLLDLYVDCPNEPNVILKRFTQWEKRFNKHHEFYFYYGKVCERQKLWGKAQQHFEKSIELKPSVESFVSLAEINKLTNNETAAIANWKKAAHHSLKKD